MNVMHALLFTMRYRGKIIKHNGKKRLGKKQICEREPHTFLIIECLPKWNILKILSRFGIAIYLKRSSQDYLREIETR